MAGGCPRSGQWRSSVAYNDRDRAPRLVVGSVGGQSCRSPSAENSATSGATNIDGSLSCVDIDASKSSLTYLFTTHSRENRFRTVRPAKHGLSITVLCECPDRTVLRYNEYYATCTRSCKIYCGVVPSA